MAGTLRPSQQQRPIQAECSAGVSERAHWPARLGPFLFSRSRINIPAVH